MASAMTADKICDICKLSETNVYDNGDWKTSDGCTVHYFCLLLSTHAQQNGEDDEGIGGFLVPDIRYLIKSHTKTKCMYCRKTGASVRCFGEKCNRYFHVICGVKNNCLNQFEDPFRSFCHLHVKIEEDNELHRDFWHCQICQETMGLYNPLTSIPSCCNQGYYHKKCMQKYAIAAGYLAKCPSCGNDADGYRKLLSKRGIFCPDKDADWELSNDAYQSLLYVYKRCDAAECKCPKGQNYVKKRGEWKIVKCYCCGAAGVHSKCNNSTESYICPNCLEKSRHAENSSDIPQNTTSSNTHVNQPSTSKACNENAMNDSLGKDKHWCQELHDENENKVWKLVDTNLLTFRKATMHLTEPDKPPNDDPLCDNERKNMRKNRLDMFFARADFGAKPPPPPWLI